MQGTPVSERAVPVALFGKEVGIANFFSLFMTVLNFSW
jgi:hypothetical protein